MRQSRRDARRCQRLAAGDFGDGLDAAADVEPFVNAADVGVSGRDAEVEDVGDFLVVVAAGEELEDFVFARGEVAAGGGAGRGGAFEGLDDLPRDAGGDGRAAFVNFPDSG